MRISRQAMLTEMAVSASKRSTCLRKQVGTVISREGRPLSIGYNGSPAGQPHCTKVGCLIDPVTGACIRTIHSEVNAITYAARYGIELAGALMYTTVSPCKPCADAIIGAGLYGVWYKEEYRVKEPIQYLRQAGIVCELIADDDDL
jgi:dCMP deaminase